MFKVLNSIRERPKSLMEVQMETRISQVAFYNTVIPSLKELGLIEETYEIGKHNTVKRLIKITERGKKLLEILTEIWTTVEVPQ